MLKIWGRPNSINVQKVMWAVGELGVPHERIDAGGKFGGLDDGTFAAMNPNKRIPVIDDDGVFVWESHAIVRYLAAKYGRDILWPEDPAARARVDMWTDWTASELQPAVIGVFWNYFRTPVEQHDRPLIERHLARTADLLRVLDSQLANKAFIGGDRLTFGDIPAGAQFYRYFTMDIERPALPNVEAWYARLSQRDAYRTHVMVPYADMKGRLSF